MSDTLLKAPVEYIGPEDFLGDRADEAFAQLRHELAWVQRDDTPRQEYYANDTDVPYAYRTYEGMRSYSPQPWHDMMLEIRSMLENITGNAFDVCFLNMYLHGLDHLGWHADDSPEMEPTEPIVTVSLGAERPIDFKPQGTRNSEAERLILQHGSAAIMKAGMQQDWLHRIPKIGHEVGERISLTFRVYSPQESS